MSVSSLWTEDRSASAILFDLVLSPVLPPDNRWMVVTVKQTTALIHSDSEVWHLLPRRRYVVTANLASKLDQHLDRVSELQNSYQLSTDLSTAMASKSLLAVRHLDRGVGDLLFMTGLFRYVQHLAGGNCEIHAYADADKGQVFSGNQDLYTSAAFAGPIELDHLHLYDRHLLLESLTEYHREEDQLNVYDALFKRCGFDYTKVPSEFKRPFAAYTKSDQGVFDALSYFVAREHKLDLRRTGYYVVAPISTSSLRTAKYSMWLELIAALAKELPVVLIGQTYAKTPLSDMTAHEFSVQATSVSGNVINLIDQTPTRSAMALIRVARCVFCVDSGPLYMAQAYSVPAVSVWGTHHPGVRIGYSPEYMETAVWNHAACPASPCYAHSGFTPQCPRGEHQFLCEPMMSATSDQLLEKLEVVKRRAAPYVLGTFPRA